MSDITQQISGSTKGGKRYAALRQLGADQSRKYESSDTESESTEPLQRHINHSRQTLAYATKSVPKKNTPSAAAPHLRAQAQSGSTSSNPPLATNHQVAAGPGWVQPLGGEADALDRLITGIKAGDVQEAEVSKAMVATDIL